ncbi:MAG: NapC/NirT family cytochrome c [bacterium]|nr:NapC/NirT family cytochrome c [bacterium]
MSLTRKNLMILAAILGMLALTACTREITTIVQEDPQPSSCFECHSDTDLSVLRAQTEWSESVHGEGETVFEGTRADCVRCHCNEGFIQYVDDPTRVTYSATSTPTNINCFTCHAPHSNGDFGLRVTEAVPMLNGEFHDLGLGNTCTVCHQARRDVAVYITSSNSITNRYGPHHGPQGDLLLGTNGYEYAGYTYTETPYHRTMNEDGCVNCHMRNVAHLVGGHTFNVSTYNAEEDETVYNTGACVGCHTDWPEDLENFDYNGVQTEIAGLLAELHALLLDAGYVNASGVPVTRSAVPADIAGAIWNFQFVGAEDRSNGVHNPAYARDLLQSSIAYMESLIVPTN